MQIFLVGGAVRDRLLGIKNTDRDWVVTGSSPEEMLAQGFTPVGQDFPVFLHPETGEEYALARTERKTGKGYTGFTFHASPDVTLEEDLGRRDLTINAMAEGEEGNLVDPFNGREDLENGILRHVSEAFAEDPLRILRVARFLARYHRMGFAIHRDTLELMKLMVARGEVEHLTAERVWKEMEKAMAEPSPDRFFMTLRECGALKVLFPEVDRLFGVPQPAKWHPEIDTGVHTMMAIQQAAKLSANPIVVFATLAHDLGKGTTPEEMWPSHKGHEYRGVSLVNNLCDRYRIPNQYRELALMVTEYHTHVMRAKELRDATLVDTISTLDGWRRPGRIEPFLLACEADMRGRTGWENREYPQRQYFSEAVQAGLEIDISELVTKGYEGKKMGEQVRRKRIARIRQWRNQHHSSPGEQTEGTNTHEQK